tara:strand:- start:4027 stop:4242 length:216 start_codon:yes stop_codon:yes gene_type:complete
MVGSSKVEASRVDAFFQKYGHSPELVANAIVSTIKHNREQVAVGLEAKLLYRLLPLVPRSIQGMITGKVPI